MRCLEDRKVSLVVFLLQKGAKDWWWLAEGRWEKNMEPTWEYFKEAFYKKYFP